MQRAVGLFDVAEDTTGADRGKLLIITNQPDTPAGHLNHGRRPVGLQHTTRCTATAQPKLPKPSIPTRWTWWVLNMSTSWAKPRSVLGTSPPATSRPVSSTTATASVSLWVPIPAIT
jgi:hypothetical protein